MLASELRERAGETTERVYRGAGVDHACVAAGSLSLLRVRGVMNELRLVVLPRGELVKFACVHRPEDESQLLQTNSQRPRGRFFVFATLEKGLLQATEEVMKRSNEALGIVSLAAAALAMPGKICWAQTAGTATSAGTAAGAPAATNSTGSTATTPTAGRPTETGQQAPTGPSTDESPGRQRCEALRRQPNSFVVIFDEDNRRMEYPPETPLDGEQIYLCVASRNPWNRYGLTFGARQSGDTGASTEQKNTIGIVSSQASTTVLRVSEAIANAEGECQRLAEPHRGRCTDLRSQIEVVLGVQRTMVVQRDALAQLLTDLASRPLDAAGRNAAAAVANALCYERTIRRVNGVDTTALSGLVGVPRWSEHTREYSATPTCQSQVLDNGVRIERHPTTIESLINALLPNTIHWVDGQWHFLSPDRATSISAAELAREIAQLFRTPAVLDDATRATITAALARAREQHPSPPLPEDAAVLRELTAALSAPATPRTQTRARPTPAEVSDALTRSIAAQLADSVAAERVISTLTNERSVLLGILRSLMENYSSLAVLADRIATTPVEPYQLFSLGSFGANTVVQATLNQYHYGVTWGAARDRVVYDSSNRQFSMSLTIHGTSYFQVQTGGVFSLLPTRHFSIEPSTTMGQGTIRLSEPFTYAPAVFVNVLWCSQDVGVQHYARRCRGRNDAPSWRHAPTLSIGVPLSEQLFAPSAFVGVSLPYIPYVSIIAGLHMSMLQTLRPGLTNGATTTETDIKNLTELVPHGSFFVALTLNTEIIAALQTAARPAQ